MTRMAIVSINVIRRIFEYIRGVVSMLMTPVVHDVVDREEIVQIEIPPVFVKNALCIAHWTMPDLWDEGCGRTFRPAAPS